MKNQGKKRKKVEAISGQYRRKAGKKLGTMAKNILARVKQPICRPFSTKSKKRKWKPSPCPKKKRRKKKEETSPETIPPGRRAGPEK